MIKRYSRWFTALLLIQACLHSYPLTAASPQSAIPLTYPLSFPHPIVAFQPSETKPKIIISGQTQLLLCKDELCKHNETLTFHNQNVSLIDIIQYSDDGKYLAIATPYGVIVYDADSYPIKRVAQLGYAYAVSGLNFCTEGKKLVVARLNRVVIWDFLNATKEIPKSLEFSEDGVLFLDRVWNADTFACAIGDKIGIWNLSNPVPRIVPTSEPGMMALVFGQDEEHFACYSGIFSNHSLVDLFSGSQLLHLFFPAPIIDMVYSPKINRYMFFQADSDFCLQSLKALHPDDGSTLELLSFQSKNQTHASPCFDLNSLSHWGSRLLMMSAGSGKDLSYAYLNTIQLYQEAIKREALNAM